MGSKVSYIDLGSIIKIYNGKPYSTLREIGNIPVFGSGGLMGYTDDFMYKGEAILLPRKGTLNNIQYLNLGFWVVDTTYFAVVKKAKADTKFLRNYLTLISKHIAENLNSGSAVPSMTQKAYEQIKILLPDLPTQRAIAHILSQLDEKIELNRKINAELESLARTLYGYWFMQFDFPNVDGKPYRQNGGAFEYNKQMNRNIPVGWQVKTVKHCVKKISTGLNPRKNFVLGKGTNKYLTIKNIDNGRLLFDSCDLIDDEALKIIHARSDISVGDILFTSIDPVGRLYYILEKPEGWDINESVFSVRTNTQIVSNEYLYSVFDSDYFKAQTLPLMTGSVQKGIRIAALESIPLVVPEARIIKAYTEKVRSIYERKAKIEKESIELAALRDFLLPLLMNGQVTVEGIA